MADMHTPLQIRQIGEIEFDGPDGAEGVTGVLLEGSVEAVREAARLFGQPVRLVSAAPSQDAETMKALREQIATKDAALDEAKAVLTDLDARLIDCGPLHTAEDAYDTTYRGMVIDALVTIDTALAGSAS